MQAAASLPKPLVEFRSVTKTFGGITAVDRVSLTIQPGEFFALLGASGCGKTTLMRMLAGFETPNSGAILLDGMDLSGQPPHRRPVNMMFQSYALFPHMRVAENIAFGLKQEGLPRSEIARRVEELLSLVKLEGLARRKPSELSGGQRQRVALARALAKRPKLLLLDEPLSALDRKLREATQRELKELQARLGAAFLVVTHDQEEAMTMADRIAVMDRGRIIQIDAPRDLYESPTNRQIAEFVGDISMIEGRAGPTESGETSIATSVGMLRVGGHGKGLSPGDAIWVALRPEKITIGRSEPLQTANKVFGKISAVSYFGGATLIQVAVPGQAQPFKVSVANTARSVAHPLTGGDQVWLSWSIDAGIVLTA